MCDAGEYLEHIWKLDLLFTSLFVLIDFHKLFVQL